MYGEKQISFCQQHLDHGSGSTLFASSLLQRLPKTIEARRPAPLVPATVPAESNLPKPQASSSAPPGSEGENHIAWISFRAYEPVRRPDWTGEPKWNYSNRFDGSTTTVIGSAQGVLTIRQEERA